MSTRSNTHPSLPAPVFQSGAASIQSKSRVLAGVQDAYWSDDEAEDQECPLCLEEMDISDLGFRPCPCGYQICRFCWHHIKENLNGRCPACRREYTDEAVQFKPINKEDHKRLTQQKKQRERERKDLETLGRRHLANVRVVQRNVVYIVNMSPRFAKEELIPTLRSNDYFAQYGKISKIVIVKRTSTSRKSPVIGLYVTYHRKEDAARCIGAVDGAPSPGGGGDVMRASYGTTKYCMIFLRGQTCSDHGCMNLHEWGDEKDCFTKEDLTTLKHTLKDTEDRPRVVTIKKIDEAEGVKFLIPLSLFANLVYQGLPRTAGWAKNATSTTTSSRPGTTKRIATTRPPRTTTPSSADIRITARAERKATAAKPPSQPSSRPQTPSLLTTTARPTTPSVKAKPRDVVPSLPPTLQSAESPALSPPPVSSDAGSVPQEASIESPALRPQSAQSEQFGLPPAPPGIPPPPGLLVPPGLLPPTWTQATDSALPQVSYQMSSQAQALIDDLRARREASASTSAISPFPDIDRTLQVLTGGDDEYGGFSFNLDPKLAGDGVDTQMEFPDLDAEASMPFQGSFLEAFPGLANPTSPVVGFAPPPGLSYIHNSSRSIYDAAATRPPQPNVSSGYMGCFNPFDSKEEQLQQQYSPFDDDSTRKVSRFGFARGKQHSAAASPLPPTASLQNDMITHPPYYDSPDLSTTNSVSSQWNISRRQNSGYLSPQSRSVSNSPAIHQAQAISPFLQQQLSQFQPFDSDISEAQLRDFINSSRDHANASQIHSGMGSQWDSSLPNSPFTDPAIMSASMSSNHMDPSIQMSLQQLGSYASNPGFGPPPGLTPPTQLRVGSNPTHSHANVSIFQKDTVQASGSAHVSPSPTPSVALSLSDFPALQPSSAETNPPTRSDQPSPDSQETSRDTAPGGTQPKLDAKALKKATQKAAAERTAERQRILQEKAALRAAEKQKAVAEKERLKKEKEDREREEKERVACLAEERAEQEKEKARRDKVAKEQAALVAVEKQKQQQAIRAVKLAKHQGPTPAKVADIDRSPTPGSTNTVEIIPMLSKMPKKYKPVTKPIKIPKDDHNQDGSSAQPSAVTAETPDLPEARLYTGTETNSTPSRSISPDRASPTEVTSVEELLVQIDMQAPYMNVSRHPIFDMSKINPAAKMPLEYGPLVHALSALSVGGGSFANAMPSGSIDNAVSSFQQLLETLTQTISDLLRLLPRTTWDDSSSFDGVLRDMLKGDDFLDDGNEEGINKEDEVAALTMALERRARWMEVQLSKLEELHRDINMAAVRAVLSFNDNGWDAHGFMPRTGNTLEKFTNLGIVREGNGVRLMTVEELEKKLAVAREAAVFAETEVRETMAKLQELRPEGHDEYY
ncbi:hypothetical protein BDM02DRAFT_3182296 [Thelephora ganbajun]|uniref:Uncharacterized protein n=1 Tax=Thelephora ganbajun TaxID=370292 RepID=A0ACB6ZWR7_THEGA|nr:hypothetical protein BDM02DRAFT_3182296 [Thelephora ganbajun]